MPHGFTDSQVRAEALLAAAGNVPHSYLARYLGLRELATQPLWGDYPGVVGRIKSTLRSTALTPLVQFHEQLLGYLRKDLLQEARSARSPGGRPRLVYLAPFDVLSRNGGATRVLGLAKALAGSYEVSIISVVGPLRALEVIPVAPGCYIYAIPQTAAFVQAVERDAKELGGAATSLGLDRHLDELPLLRYWFRQLGRAAAVCILNQPYLLRLCREEWTSGTLLYDVPEVNSFFTLRMAGKDANLEQVKSIQAELERGACQLAHFIGLCAPVDMDRLAQEQGEAIRSKLALVPNGIWVDESPFLPPSQAQDLRKACGWDKPTAVFLGSAAYPPNTEAVQFIAEHLAPGFPQLWFVVMGMDEADTGLARIPANVHCCGRVSDAAKSAILGMADMALSPIRSYDSGSSLKIADYVAHGKPVVATAVGLRGYESLGEAVLPVALPDIPARMGELLAKLDRDPACLDASCVVTRDRLRQHYDWSAIAAPYVLSGTR